RGRARRRWRRGHPRWPACRGRARSDRRAAGRAGAPRHRRRLRPLAELAAQFRDSRRGRRGGGRQVRGGAGPPFWGGRGAGGGSGTARTGGTGPGRARPGPLDAVSAARAAQSGRASGAPRGRDGAVEAIRALMVAKRSARQERTQAINQARALIVTGPEELRPRFGQRSPAQLIEAIAALRPRPGEVPGYATRVALRELGRRAQFLDAQLERLDELISPLVTARAPGLLALHGVGPDTAAVLLVAADDHPERLRSESSWAHLCGAAPIAASSGKTAGRDRLNPGGDRQANTPPWRIWP